MVCEDGILVDEWVQAGGDYPPESGSQTESGSATETGSESGSQTETGSGTEEEECSGPCCHGGSFVKECVGQPCDVPNDYDYESKAAQVDPKSPYYSEIQK